MSRSLLLLGTGNKVRTIMAEAYINHVGAGQWRAHSAGCAPAPAVDPCALAALAEAGITLTDVPHPKGIERFACPSAPVMDVIVTLCGEVADMALLTWPGAPLQIHWPLLDPSALPLDTESRREAFRVLLDRIRAQADEFLVGSRVIG